MARGKVIFVDRWDTAVGRFMRKVCAAWIKSPDTDEALRKDFLAVVPPEQLKRIMRVAPSESGSKVKR